MELLTTFRKRDASGYFYGSRYFETEEAFGVTIPFSETYRGGFQTLNEGDVIEVDLYLVPSALVSLCWEIPPLPVGDITSAKLVLELDVAIAAEPSTWGRIKALYDGP